MLKVQAATVPTVLNSNGLKIWYSYLPSRTHEWVSNVQVSNFYFISCYHDQILRDVAVLFALSCCLRRVCGILGEKGPVCLERAVTQTALMLDMNGSRACYSERCSLHRHLSVMDILLLLVSIYVWAKVLYRRMNYWRNFCCCELLLIWCLMAIDCMRIQQSWKSVLWFPGTVTHTGINSSQKGTMWGMITSKICAIVAALHVRQL